MDFIWLVVMDMVKYLCETFDGDKMNKHNNYYAF